VTDVTHSGGNGHCEHCHHPGDTLVVAYGDAEHRLHRGCIDAWQAAQ
jgi:hypothetical protein